MSDRLLVFIDIEHASDDGEVDEIDAIEAMREVMDALYQSKESRDSDRQMLISSGFFLGGEEGDKQKRVAVLISSPDLVGMINSQIAHMIDMNRITSLGPKLKDILEYIQKNMNNPDDGTDDTEN